MPEVLQLVGAYADKTDTVKLLFSVNYDHKKGVTIQMKSAIVRFSATVLKEYHKVEMHLWVIWKTVNLVSSWVSLVCEISTKFCFFPEKFT